MKIKKLTIEILHEIWKNSKLGLEFYHLILF